MSIFIRDAGGVVWPVLLFGLLGLVAAIRYAWSPRRERLAVVAGLLVATLLIGVLGTVLGFQASAFASVNSAVPTNIFIEGMRESFNNTVAALVFGLLQALVATYGTFRHARAPVPAQAR